MYNHKTGLHDRPEDCAGVWDACRGVEVSPARLRQMGAEDADNGHDPNLELKGNEDYDFGYSEAKRFLKLRSKAS
jgi:hypothetical protein